jgi:EamA domain-containing membrane protein RarD
MDELLRFIIFWSIFFLIAVLLACFKVEALIEAQKQLEVRSRPLLP